MCWSILTYITQTVKVGTVMFVINQKSISFTPINGLLLLTYVT
jgi:hypothetical protein